MSHEITKSDGLVLHAEKAWHGLGRVVEEAPSPADALRMAGLDWTVDRQSLFTEDGEEVAGHKAIRRSDNGEVLSVVGHNWTAVQNSELADIVYDVCGSEVTIESAGSIRGGRKVWFLAQTGSVWDIEGDEVKPYIMFLNGHDGAQSLRVVPTTVRVVCSNTLHMADAAREGAAWSFRHTGTVRERIGFARDAIARAVRGLDEMGEEIETLANVSLNSKAAIEWFTSVYQRSFGQIPANPTTKGEKKRRTRAEEIVGQWMASFRGETGKQAEETEGTVWSALNAITEWSDHNRTVRRTGGASESEARVHTNWFGPASQWKADLFRQTVAEFA